MSKRMILLSLGLLVCGFAAIAELSDDKVDANQEFHNYVDGSWNIAVEKLMHKKRAWEVERYVDRKDAKRFINVMQIDPMPLPKGKQCRCMPSVRFVFSKKGQPGIVYYVTHLESKPRIYINGKQHLFVDNGKALHDICVELKIPHVMKWLKEHKKK